MNKTGQAFEMNPETFTLENVFAMEQHRYHESIAEIVTAATKELSIEKVRCIVKQNIKLAGLIIEILKMQK